MRAPRHRRGGAPSPGRAFPCCAASIKPSPSSFLAYKRQCWTCALEPLPGIAQNCRQTPWPPSPLARSGAPSSGLPPSKSTTQRVSPPPNKAPQPGSIPARPPEHRRRRSPSSPFLLRVERPPSTGPRPTEWLPRFASTPSCPSPT